MALLAGGIGVGLFVLVCAPQVWAPVTTARLDACVRRQRLRLTPANTAVVVRYLAVTRRWRALGLATVGSFALTAQLAEGRVTADLGGWFVGWFLGAIVAEWRLSRPPRGRRRVGSMMPRRAATDLSRTRRALPWLVMATVVVVAAAVAGPTSSADRSTLGRVITVTAIVLAVFAASIAAARRVVLRPQPTDGPDEVRQVDDALRAQSLRVLGGCSVAVGGLGLGVLVANSSWADRGVTVAIYTVVTIAGVVIGWLLSLGPGSRLRPRLRAPKPVAVSCRAGQSTAARSCGKTLPTLPSR